MAKKIVNHIPSLSSLLLSGLVVATATSCGCDSTETKTATETQAEAPAQASESKATDTAEGDGSQASAQFKQMGEEQRRTLVEALNLVLADSATLETLKRSPLVHPEHEIDKADSDKLKTMGRELCKTFKAKPYAEATTLHGWTTFDWNSSSKKVARLKALNKIAEAYQLPCDIAQRIAVDLLQGADFNVLDELDNLHAYEKDVLGMHDGQNVLRADCKFSPPLEDIRQFDTTAKFLKLLRDAAISPVLDHRLAGVVVNAGTQNLQPAAEGKRGGAWVATRNIKSIKGGHLPDMQVFLNGQAPYTTAQQPTFGQLFFAVFGGDNFGSGDCLKVDMDAAGSTVNEVKVHKQNLMTILNEAKKSEGEFAKFLGVRLERQDLKEIFPVADVDVSPSYAGLKKQVSELLDSDTDAVLDKADIQPVLQSLANMLNNTNATVSQPVTTPNTVDMNAIQDAASYKRAVGLPAPATIASSEQKIASEVLTQIEAKVLANPAGKTTAFAKDVNIAIRRAEGAFLVVKEDGSYKPTELTKRFQNQIKAMESAISAKNKAAAVTYQEISGEVRPTFDVARVHAVLKEAVADLRLYLQLPSTLQSVLAMPGAKGAVNYAQVLNIPGLSKQQVSRLDDIRMKFQQKVAAMQPAAAAPAPAPAG